MTDIEVKNFLKKVKAHYQEFKIDEPFIVREWIENLCPFDQKDILEKFNEHLENESVSKEVPKIHILTKWLTPTYEKKKKKEPIKGKFPCRWCGSMCSNTYYLSLHEERCLRLRYITRMCKKFSINPESFFGKNLIHITLEELNNGYDNFILRVIEEEKKQKKLSLQEKIGIKTYYNNVIKKEKK